MITVEDGALSGGTWDAFPSPHHELDGTNSRAVVEAYMAALNAPGFNALAGSHSH